MDNLNQQLNQLGFHDQNTYLQTHGFTDTKKNIKHLLKNKGDLSLTQKSLEKKKHKHKLEFSKLIQENNFSEQNTQLESLGFTEQKLNFKCLSKSAGNLEKAIQLLEKKKQKQELRLVKKNSYMLQLSTYKDQLEKLIQLGFDKPKKNIKVLEKVSGNLELAIEKLTKKKEKKQKRESKTQQLTEKYGQKNNFLVQNGFTDVKKNIKCLIRTKGDQEKALQILIEKKNGTDKEKREQKKKDKEQLVQFKRENYVEGIEVLYVDGNNCLFVDDKIRKLALNKNKKEAEMVIAELVQNFQIYKNIKEVVLVYDNTSLKINT